MKVILVNFATPNFKKSQKSLNKSALKFGADKCISYNKSILKKTDFYQKNRMIFDQERGAGYWLWKPYIIYQTLIDAEDGDIIIYSDSGAEIISPLSPLLDLCKRKNGILLFQVHSQNGKHLNIKWTKRDCFTLMGADEPKYHNAEQVAGSPQIYMKNNRNLAFIEEWLSYCTDERILTDMPNRCGLENYPEFKDHRHDQSVISILAAKHGIEIFRDPSQYGNHLKLPAFHNTDDLATGLEYSAKPYTNSPYGTIFQLHRRRNFSLLHRAQKTINKIRTLLTNSTKEIPPPINQPEQLSIGITTFEHRFKEYFIPLLTTIRKFDPDIEVIVSINGEHNLPFNEDYRKQILSFLATQRRVFPIFFPQFRGVSKLWNTIVIHASNNNILLLNDDIAITNPNFPRIIKGCIKKNRHKSFTVNNSFSHFVIARDELDTIGYFDEKLLGIGEEDGDFVWRYMKQYGEPLPNFELDCFKNFAAKTSDYIPPHIACHSSSKYSRFNRSYMFNEKYKKVAEGIQGMFDYPVELIKSSPKQYPNEDFYRKNKNKL
ncbi:MAG: hypothetical protein OEY01_01450 [Desulfobulbaceae bacterium]|nr:hypothetical protein [Desulfobulbaceae bacterium]HIJ77957.1 glycosyltransferase family 2 protein [Deltaproteobacteria bacterium]